MVFYVIKKLRSSFERTRSMKDVDNNTLTTFDIIVMMLSFIALVLFLFESFASLSDEHKRLLSYIDTGICCIFIIDFIIDFKEAKNKLHFMKWGWIDLLSSIPSLDILRWGRVFRVLRLLKAISSLRVMLLHSYGSKKNGMITVAFIGTVLVLIFSSVTILYFERGPESNIKTAEDAIWWTFTTITTVGYGDRFPVTTEGRAVGVLTMIVGISVFSIVTAYIASVFIKQQNQCKEE